MEDKTAWRVYSVLKQVSENMNVNRFVVISGCSGGGKSTLLIELGQRGYATVQEPGRRIVKEEMLGAGLALPWVNEIAFAQRAVVEIALADRASVIREIRSWGVFWTGDCSMPPPPSST